MTTSGRDERQRRLEQQANDDANGTLGDTLPGAVVDDDRGGGILEGQVTVRGSFQHGSYAPHDDPEPHGSARATDKPAGGRDA